MKNLTKLTVVALAILLTSCVFEYGGNGNTDPDTRSWAVITVSNLHDGSTIEVVEILNTDTGVPVDLTDKSIVVTFGDVPVSESGAVIASGRGLECDLREPGAYKVTYKVNGGDEVEKTFYTEKRKVYKITLQADGKIYYPVIDDF